MQPPFQLGVLIVNILLTVKLIAVENSPTNLEIYGQEGKIPNMRRCTEKKENASSGPVLRVEHLKDDRTIKRRKVHNTRSVRIS